MNSIFPKKLKPGDHLRVIAPSRSLGLLGQETISIANKRLQKMGFELSFGKYVKEMDDFASTTIEHRLADLHEAFADQSVDGILTVIGGFNSNQLLQHLDWAIIKNNPKVFCGYSDITALNNSIYTKTGLVTYSGPHYSTFGQKLNFEYTQEYFEKILMSDQPIEIKPSSHWFDDMWWLNQDERQAEKNTGYTVINPGTTNGTILGANLCTLNLLQGTEFMPDLTGAVVFVEDDDQTFPALFDRDLQSLIHLPNFKNVKGLVIGRFQKKSQMTAELLRQIIKSKKELAHIPVIAEADFGHTDPKITLPIGGKVALSADQNGAKITFLEH
ncbi:MAG: peptidase S66 [Candidatus Pacebacteria bacterium RIFOXYB1_FULL_39_46]|nr:MAG: peptidase S66 [Candidatus Pacebacteria bacterium RIFOXYB1_FULL_39_46]OGJ39266.1 MAG: peptidase S66 [Candidatus Pacebacteria bacterium RIFOXYA1_FULL_38_18]OGJ40945.1 MAG: peptidase S66 [Candidatus Pacebacteria bacterium RIFOXYD1_FULL_39_27]OGJ41127.1 MAG: peptidase S66 [Candidatus Pacebacteria bacterium RIFOXYC1_FULL_39_21]